MRMNLFPSRMGAALLALSVCAAPTVMAAPSAEDQATIRDERMAWFRDAKFGMFIHWGLYAIPAKGEWVMYNTKSPVAKYAELAAQFNPEKFNAEAWVRVAKDAGMKYIVITAKHHDGFAMFGSKVSPYNIVDATPFKRDPLKELAAACAKEGIKLGFYYSHSQDWHHPGGSVSSGSAKNVNGSWDPAQKGDFDHYLNNLAIPQIKELLANYGPVCLLWCDTPFQMTPARGGRIVAAAHATQPATLINSRLMHHGRQIPSLNNDQLDELGKIGVDYLSYADRTIPGKAQWRDWETCMTLNHSWGYTKGDNQWKSPQTLIQQLIEVASKGGNFLLNVGPTAEGEIPDQSVKNLKEVGDWLKTNGEAIYGAGPSCFPQGAQDKGAEPKDKPAKAAPTWRCTTKPGAVYIHLLKWPGTSFELKQFPGKAAKACWLGDPAHASVPMSQEGNHLRLTLPEKSPGTVPVLKIELEK